MADRVFPNNTELDMGSKISFSGIDWASVEDNLKNNRFSQLQDDPSSKIIALLEQSGYSLDESEEAEVQQLVDQALSEKANLEGGESDGEDHTMFEEDMSDDLEGDDMTSGPEDESKSVDMVFESHDPMAHFSSNGNNKMKKIAFTKPEQISAEAIEKAMADGNFELVNTIKAARKANRQRIANALISRMKTAESEQAVTKQAVDAFQSPTKFSSSTRDSFKKIAKSLGMPEEYVEKMCGPVEKPLSSKVKALNGQIKELFSTSLPESVKTASIKALIKEAELSGESKKEFVDYWNNVLGYQDKDFWPAAAEDYSEGKKGN